MKNKTAKKMHIRDRKRLREYRDGRSGVRDVWRGKRHGRAYGKKWTEAAKSCGIPY